MNGRHFDEPNSLGKWHMALVKLAKHSFLAIENGNSLAQLAKRLGAACQIPKPIVNRMLSLGVNIPNLFGINKLLLLLSILQSINTVLFT